MCTPQDAQNCKKWREAYPDIRIGMCPPYCPTMERMPLLFVLGMPPLGKTVCDECGKSLLCRCCGQVNQNKVRIVDNVVSPWYFCSDKCKEKFLARKPNP